MTISDALPVQFWLAGAETFNEKEPQGVFRKCFCHPWQCDDEIKVQGLADTGNSYQLIALDSDGDVLFNTPFTEIATGVYSASFIPSEEGICDQDIQLFITTPSDLELLSNPDFETALTPWTSEAGANANWTWDAGEYAVATGTTDNITQPFASKPAGMYVFEFRSFSEANGYTLIIEVFNAAVLVQQVVNEVLADGTLQTRQRIAEVTGAFNTIKIRMVAPSGTPEFQLHRGSMQTVVDIHKSDCLNIKTIQDETVLISYSNDRNFASLNYSNVTPDPEFNLRVPATFFHERFPEESEVIELSNSRSIQLNAQVKAQRKLEIFPMPYYMHRKLKLVLKHQFVEIDSQEWVQSEAYELIESSNRRYAKVKATVWLDEKDYIQRNIL